jgi:hypothetical protein
MLPRLCKSVSIAAGGNPVAAVALKELRQAPNFLNRRPQFEPEIQAL